MVKKSIVDVFAHGTGKARFPGSFRFSGLQPLHTASAQQLYRRDAEWTSEAFVFIEFSNILATYERISELASDEADRLLSDAQARVREAASLPAAVALSFARRNSVSAYDARFLAAAEMLGGRLVTEDAKRRGAAPTLTQSLAEAVSRQ